MLMHLHNKGSYHKILRNFTKTLVGTDFEKKLQIISFMTTLLKVYTILIKIKSEGNNKLLVKRLSRVKRDWRSVQKTNRQSL